VLTDANVVSSGLPAASSASTASMMRCRMNALPSAIGSADPFGSTCNRRPHLAEALAVLVVNGPRDERDARPRRRLTDLFF